MERYSIAPFVEQTAQRDRGEVFQMRFEGDDFVVIQPYEETHLRRKGDD